MSRWLSLFIHRPPHLHIIRLLSLLTVGVWRRLLDNTTVKLFCACGVFGEKKVTRMIPTMTAHIVTECQTCHLPESHASACHMSCYPCSQTPSQMEARQPSRCLSCSPTRDTFMHKHTDAHSWRSHKNPRSYTPTHLSHMPGHPFIS